MVMVLVLLVVVRCPMVGEDDERQYVAFSFLPFSNLNDDTIPTCVSTYGASHMKFGWRGTHHFPPNRTRHTEYVILSPFAIAMPIDANANDGEGVLLRRSAPNYYHTDAHNHQYSGVGFEKVWIQPQS